MLITRKRAAGREKGFVGRSGPEWRKVVLGREISRGQIAVWGLVHFLPYLGSNYGL